MRTVTIIDHTIRLHLELSCNEYCVLEFIHKGKKVTRQELADIFGITRRAMIALIQRMLDKGFITRDDEANLTVTKKWIEKGEYTSLKSNTFELWQPAQPLRLKNFKTVSID